jgi:hypothetical protein
MASHLTIRFTDQSNRVFIGRVKNGVVSLISSPQDLEHSILEADIKLQSWPSFTVVGDVNISVMAKIGAKTINTKVFKTRELKIIRGETCHSLYCLVKNIDLREFFGSIHEHSS